jgi:S1-C subfamily serine protease
MNKYSSHVGVFVLGFIVCALAFRVLLMGGGGGAAVLESVTSPHPGLKIAGTNQAAQAAAIVSKYVVSIDTVGRPMLSAPEGIFGFPLGAAQEVVPKGKGSGVIISPNGYIVTNNHVAEGATHLTVTLQDGSQYDAKLIGRDPKTDIAVIKIGKSGLDAAKFADSDTLEVGDWVIAVGNALGLGPTVTSGIISATKRGPISIENEVLENVIQTDAAINRGNSGGALADLAGNLVGINTAIASSGPDGGSIGIGFAVPSKTVENVANELIKTGKVRRPWLGIVYQPYNADTRKNLQQRGATRLPNEDGALVREVMDGSPAADARIQPFDIILKINGKPISGTGKVENGKVTVASEIGASKIGARVTMEVWHAANQRTSTIGARVGEMPTDLAQPKQEQRGPQGSPFGP